MPEIKWTKQQQQAIEEKDTNILVAAAAGSGKTAVLVERIIHKIVEEKMNLDQLLVVTFTNAAASEMRERILEAIYQKLEQFPEEEHLAKQIHLLNKASICTIHAFCLEVIKNHFFEIQASPNFRIGDTSEIELLKQETLEELFEQKYEVEDEDFLKLVHTYTSYRGDEPLKELIDQVYQYIQSSPFPKKWLQEKVAMYETGEKEEDFSKTIWGKILLQEAKKVMEEAILNLQSIQLQLERNEDLMKFSQVIRQDVQELEQLAKYTDTWEHAYLFINAFSFAKWPIDRKIISTQKEDAKIVRDKVKKKIEELKKKIFIGNSVQAKEDLVAMEQIVKPLADLVLEFSTCFSERKREKNVIDFHDIEHFALAILVEEKQEEGKSVHTPSKVAKKYQERFLEIAIDEYQDSNLVQEYILNAISRGNNIFMVGDVKQSIYRFRQARPELFLDKYETYALKEKQKENEPLKIPLFQNFRSRKNVLQMTNLVFQDIMSKKLGDIEYTTEEYLNLGAQFEAVQKGQSLTGNTEIHVIDVKEKNEEQDQESQEDQGEESSERVENSVIEARFVAKKVEDLLASKQVVWDKKQGYRPITYRDIVILLRSTSTLAPIYEKALTDIELPVFSDTSSEYLTSVEMETMIAYLKILDNPYQDIPLVTILRSMIGGFTDNDLIEIRLADPYGPFYLAMQKAKLQVEEKLKAKIENFLAQLQQVRQRQEYLSLEELIWKIYMDTGYYHYVGLMPNGALRQANLKMLFERAKDYEKASFKGLFQFIHFMEKLKKSSGDLGSAKIIGENENVIRIMSIHKSKGLEFPVVFLCATGKHFNLQDLNQSVLLHQELGLGLKYIDYEKRIQYNTMAKEAIRIQMRKETLAEEMRILYVALTRAKEKLIITGIAKDAALAQQEKEEKQERYKEEKKEGKLSSYLVESYTSYLDWLTLVYLNHKEEIVKQEEAVCSFEIHTKQEILDGIQDEKQEEKEEKLIIEQIEERAKKNKEEYKESKRQEIEEKLEWKYPSQIDVLLPGKLSVTKLKQMKQEMGNATKSKQEVEKEEWKKPEFLKDNTTLSPAQKGTCLHAVLQRLDPKQAYTKEKIIEQIEEMKAKRLLSPLEASSISVLQIEQYIQSNIWQEVRRAKQVEREKPFYLSVPAKEIYQQETQSNILVQGMIDLFYINAEGELVLVDYKTDYVVKGEEEQLRQKYATQLMLYQKAIEEARNQKVDKVWIYSTCLGKEIDMTK